jgi:hypothetical protein
MVTKLLVAGFLLAHGAIHASYLSPRPPVTAGGPSWPFELERSWLLSSFGLTPELTRTIGRALVAATIGGLGFAACVAAGIAPAALWAPAVSVGAVASGALLLLFFHPWLVIGLAIDAGLMWAALSGWLPATAASL